ncbi:MAG TPA: hypothetical protein VLA44_10080 [Clostridia bacterium]|nr:hypothetical protein [Clostridia bacterium]
MTDGRRSLQLAGLLTASAGAYAIALAAIAGLQSAADRAVIAQRAPTSAAIERLADESAAMEQLVSRADARLAAAIRRFEATRPGLVASADELAALQAAVASVSGRAAELPASIAVPKVTRTTRNVTRTVVVHATTGASGG